MLQTQAVSFKLNHNQLTPGEKEAVSTHEYQPCPWSQNSFVYTEIRAALIEIHMIYR